MRVGVAFPQREIGNDPAAIRKYVEAVDELGFAHLVIFERLFSANIPGQPRSRSPFHEVFVILGFIAACTSRLELATAVTVLPMRQTTLVAKQAVELDVLTVGRSRLGVGIGRNEIEFQSVGQTYHDRAGRIEEQIEVLRALFTDECVTYHGRWHHLNEVGLNPRPLQRPIPIWMGGTADAAVRRVARLGDGWFAQFQADDAGRARLAEFRTYLRDAGRDPATFPIEGRINAGEGTTEDWARSAQGFVAMGLTHVYFSTMDVGCATVDDHIALLRRFRASSPAFS